MDYAEIDTLIAREQLEIFGAFHPKTDEGIGETLLLLGPREPGFWTHFTASAEYRDGAPDPIDRWSARVLTDLAEILGAQALFPFGGPPYQPFITWAMRSGRAWQSPAGPLVHDTAGMMISYRGALGLPARIALPELPAKPCKGCDQPCLTACPVNALSAHTGYNLDACHGYLDTGPECMSHGCIARRSCPVSKGYARRPEQSALHMRSFHP